MASSPGTRGTSSDSNRVETWMACQTPDTSVFTVDIQAARRLDLNEDLLADCSVEERSLVKLDGDPNGASINEDEIEAGMMWKDGDETCCLLDNFLLLNEVGRCVGLEALDDASSEEKILIFGNIIEPRPLSQGETPRLWERQEMNVQQKRSRRIVNVVAKEWCLDLTYGDESLWVISEKGRWYKLRGEQGPASALVPSPLYLSAFAEPRRKFEACMLVSRLLQDPNTRKRPSLSKIIADAVALSCVEWHLDNHFILSRSPFIAEQVGTVQNFSLKGPNVEIGAAFAIDLVKQRPAMIDKILRAEEAAKAKQQAAESRARKRQHDAARKSFDSGLTKRPRLNNEILNWPMDDTELLTIIAALENGICKVPSAMQRMTPFQGDFNPVKRMPLPPRPRVPLTEIPPEGLIGLGLDDDILGSIFSSYQAIHMLKDFLHLAPFGIEEFVKSITYRPPSEQVPPVVAEAVEHRNRKLKHRSSSTSSSTSRGTVSAIVNSTAEGLQATRLELSADGSLGPPSEADNATDRMAFCSPLFCEVVLRLIDFILEQPEHIELAQRVHKSTHFDAEIGIAPALSKLTWQQIMVELFVHIEKCALPEELGTVERVADIPASGDSSAQALVPSSKNASEAASKAQLRAPRTAKKYLEEQEAIEALYPQTTEGYMLARCKMILEELMDDPRSVPFRTKVDPEALGIPTYFDIVDKPMDLGTINDRLYTGFYCPEKIQLVSKQTANQLDNLQSWTKALSNASWKQGWYFESKLLLTQARQGIGTAAHTLGRDHEPLIDSFNEAMETLDWVVKKRAEELTAREAKRKEVLAKAEPTLHAYEASLQQSLQANFGGIAPFPSEEVSADLAELLALQDCIMLPPVWFHGVPLGFNISDAKSQTAFIKSLEDFSISQTPDIFRVQVTHIFPDQAKAHEGLLESILVGDRLVSVNGHVAANMDNAAVLDIFRACVRFPFSVSFARKKTNAFRFPSVQLIPEEFLKQRQEEREAERVRLAEEKQRQRQEQEQEQQEEQEDGGDAQTKPKSRLPSPNGEDDDEDLKHIHAEESGRSGGLDSFYADVQLVFTNCFKFNSKRAHISVVAQELKDLFEVRYQQEVIAVSERIDLTRARRKKEAAAKRSWREVTLWDAVEYLDGRDVQDIPPRVRVWLLEWLLECVLQSDDVRVLIESGRPSEALFARAGLSKPRGKNALAHFTMDQPSLFFPTKLAGSAPGISGGTFDTPPPLYVNAVVPSQLTRFEPIGCDRLLNRYWWFDEDPYGRIFVELAPSVIPSPPNGPSTGDASDPGNEASWQPDTVTSGLVVPSVSAQMDAIRKRSLAMQSLQEANGRGEPKPNASDSSVKLTWGALWSRAELDHLIASLNPLGRNEFDLLQALEVLYRRASTRMEVTALMSTMQSGAIDYARLDEVYTTPFHSAEASAKVAYGKEAILLGRVSQRKIREQKEYGPAQPPVASQVMAPLIVSHFKYQNSRAARKAGLAAGLQALNGPIQEQESSFFWGSGLHEKLLPPCRPLGADIASPPDGHSARDLLVNFLVSLEQTIWESRCPLAMGRVWPWPRARKHWTSQLDTFLKFIRHEPGSWSQIGSAGWEDDRPPLPASTRGDSSFKLEGLSTERIAASNGKAGEGSGTNETEAGTAPDIRTKQTRSAEGTQVGFLADKLLVLEAECVSYWCSAGTTSVCGTCVPLLWRFNREKWRSATRKATTLAELGLLARRLATDSIQWSDMDRSIHVLLGQHPPSHRGSPPVLPESPKASTGLFWDSRSRGSRDVTFGQLLSSGAAVSAPGFVALGAFLGALSHSALFGNNGFGVENGVAYVGGNASLAPISKSIWQIGATALGVASSAAHNTNCLGLASYVYKPRDALKVPSISVGPSGALSTVLRSVVQHLLACLGLRQKDCAQQVGCSQSHFSLWLNAREGLDKKKFETRLINWVRLKNLVHQWVQSNDIRNADGSPVDIHVGITRMENIPTGLGPGERANESMRQSTFEILLPFIRQVLDIPVGGQAARTSQSSIGNPLGQPYGVGNVEIQPQAPFTDATKTNSASNYQHQASRHPYKSIYKSALELNWTDIIPFETSTSMPRAESAIITYDSWVGQFDAGIRAKLENSGMHDLAIPDARALYYPEGHAFANAHAELRMGIEMMKGSRPGAAGPAVANVPQSRSPYFCRVQAASFHSGNVHEKFASSPYALFILAFDAPDSRMPMLDMGDPLADTSAGLVTNGGQPVDISSIQVSQGVDPSTGAIPAAPTPEKGARAENGKCSLKHILRQIMLHLLSMEQSAICMEAVSAKVYRDLVPIVGSEENIVPFELIYKRVQKEKYASPDDFLADLKKMADYTRIYFVESHKFGASIAQAASDIVMRAKLLLRHPETLCALSALENKHTADLNQAPHSPMLVIVRPHYEKAMPSFLVGENALARNANVRWTLGARVRARAPPPQQHQILLENAANDSYLAPGSSSLSQGARTGTVVGFRYPLSDMQLPWASLVVKWDPMDPNSPLPDNAELDVTLDMPIFAQRHVHPWDVILEDVAQ